MTRAEYNRQINSAKQDTDGTYWVMFEFKYKNGIVYRLHGRHNALSDRIQLNYYIDRYDNEHKYTTTMAIPYTRLPITIKKVVEQICIDLEVKAWNIL